MGNSLSSVCVGNYPDTLWVGSSTSGLGRYRRDTRHWGPTYTKESGTISSNHVTDLRPWSGGLLIASDYGLDVCREEGDLRKGELSKVDSTNKLGSRGIRSLYPRPASDGLDLWCISFGKGVSHANIRPDGKIDTPQIIISERSVAGLDESKCRMAAYNAESQILSVAFEQSTGVGIARYRFADHDWLGTNEPLPVSNVLDIQTDRSHGVLVGTEDGIWQVREQTRAEGDYLAQFFRGLKSERIAELAASSSWIWAHSQWDAPEGLSPVRLRRCLNAKDSPNQDWQWSDLIGPKRFPGLQEGDILCADYLPEEKAYYFGTKGKGIGKYHVDSHDLEPLPGSSGDNSPLGNAALIDIAVADGGVMAVATDAGELLLRNSREGWHKAWSNSKGMPLRRNDITCAAADDRLLFIGGQSVIGSYDIETHQWRQLPSINGVAKLYCTPGVLWALTESKELFSFVLTESAPQWKSKLKHIVHISRSQKGLLILAEDDNGANAIHAAGKAASDGLVAFCRPQPLESTVDSSKWKSCCATGKLLYLAGEGGNIALYDLQKHAWTTIKLPDYIDGVRQMAANSHGLWVLTDQDELVLWNTEQGLWNRAPTCENVETFARHGMDALLVLIKPDETSAGGEPYSGDRLLLVSGNSNTRVLIGQALDADIWNAKVSAAEEFNEMLFLISGGNVARYQKEGHGWKSFTLDESDDIVTALTGDYLYAIGRDSEKAESGTLFRYDPREDDFSAVRMLDRLPDGFEVRNFAGDLTQTLVMHVPGKGLYRIDDARASEADLLHGTSAVALKNAKVQCAAALDDELFLADERGNIHRHGGNNEGGAATWSVCIDSSVDADSSSGFSKIFLPHKDILAAVGNQAIDIFARTDNGSAWQRKTHISEGSGDCDAWKTDDAGKIFAALDKQASAGIYKRLAMLNLDGSSDRNIVGAAIESPSGKTRYVHQWSAAKDKFVFRVDDSGRMFRYSLRTHSWEREEIENVDSLFQSLNHLWCFDRENSTLHYLSNREDSPKWKAFEAAGPITGHASDEKFLMIHYKDAHVEFMFLDENGKIVSGQLIGESPHIKNGSDKIAISAYAELSDSLFISFEDGPTWRYDIRQHYWSKALPKEIRRFVRSSEKPRRLFALSKQNELFSWDASRERFTQINSPQPIKSVHLHDGMLWAITARHELMRYSTTGNNKWTTLFSCQSALAGERWPDIVAAVEHQGKLVLGLRPDDGGGDMVCVYDPKSMKWSQCKNRHGRIVNFISWDNRVIFLAYHESIKKRFLLDLDLSHNSARRLLDDVTDVVFNEQAAWCLTDDNRVFMIDQNKRKPVEVFSSPLMLPADAGSRLRSVRAAGNRLIAILEDGSIWHHVHHKSGWRQTLGPAESGSNFHRTILQVGSETVTSAPDGTILHFTRRTDAYGTPVKDETIGPRPAQVEWKKWSLFSRIRG